PRRTVREAGVAGEDLPLLEVDVDRAVPSAAVVLQGPDLAGPVPGSSRDAAEVGGQHFAGVRRHAPGTDERGVLIGARLFRAAAELEDALTRDRDVREVRVRDERAAVVDPDA